MFYPQSDAQSEVKRDSLIQGTLASRSGLPRPEFESDPLRWEAEPLVQIKAGPWVWFILAIIIALSLYASIVI